MKLREIKTAKTHGVYAGVYGNWEDFPKAFIVQGGWSLTLSTLQRGNLTYDIGRVMGDDHVGSFYIFFGPSSRRWVIMDNSNRAAVASKDLTLDTINPDNFKEAKKWVTDQLDHLKVLGEQLSPQAKLLPEAKVTFPSLIAQLPHDIYIKDGVFVEFHEIKPGKATFLLKRLMEDEPLGYLILFRRSNRLWISAHATDWRQTGVEAVDLYADGDKYTEDIIRDFVVRCFHLS